MSSTCLLYEYFRLHIAATVQDLACCVVKEYVLQRFDLPLCSVYSVTLCMPCWPKTATLDTFGSNVLDVISVSDIDVYIGRGGVGE